MRAISYNINAHITFNRFWALHYLQGILLNVLESISLASFNLGIFMCQIEQKQLESVVGKKKNGGARVLIVMGTYEVGFDLNNKFMN